MSALGERRVLVTGVTSGIGRATAELLVARGAQVFGWGRDQKKLDALAGALGGRFTPVAAELGSAGSRQEAIARVREATNRLDAIVNNAAECVYETPLATPLSTWERLFEVNALAPLHLIQALSGLLDGQGQIINVSSVNAHGVPQVKFAPYGASKGALAQITEALRMELAPRGVRVCQVTPGLVETELYQKVQGFERAAEKLKAAVPKWLAPLDVAEAIAWILSQPAHVTVADVVLLPRGQS